MAQRIDSLDGVDEFKRFYLQYSFPPSCVGEVGRIGAPSRREIGHGMLAERSLEPILPSEDDFPYTIRVESTITESNGSSSMASVCGGCLALQDAGVPIKGSIAGIAMGMVLDTKEFGGDGTPLILSDITGSEDASGDMDFKVAGNEDGITAFQMDIKVGGITLPIMRKALLQARDGRKHILGAMMNSSPPPAKRLSKYAPLIHVMKVRPDRINLIIGSGGRKVKSIIEESGVDTIDTEDDGTGLCHISELSSGWLPKAEDVFKVGDRIDVKLIEINEKGQLRLSHRALLPDTEASPKDGLVEEKTEQSKDKSSTPNVTASSKRSSEDDSVLPSKKFVRRLVSSSLDKPFTNKDKTKKSSNKAVGSVSGKDESSLVSGEAEIFWNVLVPKLEYRNPCDSSFFLRQITSLKLERFVLSRRRYTATVSARFRNPKLDTYLTHRVCAAMAEDDSKPLNYISEVILKKRKSTEAWALRKKEQFQQKKFQSIRKPEDFIHEYRNKEVDLIRMKRRVKRKVPEANSNTMIIIRIQGKKDMHPRTRKVLYSLGLRRRFSAVFVKPSEGIMAKLQRVEPYVTYGYPNLKSIKELIYKKGHARMEQRKVPLTDNNIIEQELGKFGIVCIEDMVHQIYNAGPHFKEVARFMWPFELNKPAEGLKGSKTIFKEGGDTGNREDLINELINKMN
ncbi:hypothetical protein JHK84_053213 [Glycine max]|nr:hypothetical protein JHK84_053213 [Glycine max]